MLIIDGKPLTLQELARVAYRRDQVSLSREAETRIAKSRGVIERILTTGQVVYGVNTGFGKLSDVHIPQEELRSLQLNLIRSHACGVGRLLSEEETRAMMLLRANVLALGFSGARVEIVLKVIELLNKGVHPAIPEKGSVGASGDLAPLAHLALTLVGEGEASIDGKLMTSGEALAVSGVIPVSLEAKEGLALLNGTQAMGAIGGLALGRAQSLCWIADCTGAMSLEALLGTDDAFDPRIHAARPHLGQRAVAEHLRELMANSEIRESHREGDPRVQDAYCLRCMPQVHGAVRDALAHVEQIWTIESGSATDNPLVFADEGDVLSGGNFHGAPIALALDYAAIALTDLASISERRIDRLINPDINEHLPAFLARHPGSSSGFMMAHVTAVALLNECKVLSHPASVDNVPTSGGKEDHVSMGVVAALKFRQIVENAEMIIAIEAMAAAEGIDHRAPLKPGKEIAKFHNWVRGIVDPLEKDRPLSGDIQRLAGEFRKKSFS